MISKFIFSKEFEKYHKLFNQETIKDKETQKPVFMKKSKKSSNICDIDEAHENVKKFQLQISFFLPPTDHFLSTTRIRFLPSDQDILRLFKFDTFIVKSLASHHSPDKTSLRQKIHFLQNIQWQKPKGALGSTQLWVTKDPLTSQERVVKVFAKNELPVSSGGETLWRLLCEKLLIITPMHRGLMRITDVIETPLNFYLFSEKLDGGELFNFLLHETAVPEEICKYIIRQILQAVEFLHSNNLLHRDIKPENLMLRYPRLSCLKKGYPKLSCLDCSRLMTSRQIAPYYELALIDFDTCRMTDISNSEYDDISHGRRRLVGTYGYLAPEILLGYPYSCASDLWSVGVILYILMTGIPPTAMDLMLDARTTLNVLQEARKNKINFNVEPFNQFPLARELCQKMLEFDPKHRLSSASEALKHPWLYSQCSGAIVLV